jgi:uncharacterized protein YaaR (DUF327 family)
MRIEGPQGMFGDALPKDKVDKRKKAGNTGSLSPPPSFVEELNAAVTEESVTDANFDTLISDVDTSGKELMAKQDEKNLKKYKDAVKRFLTAAVRKAYRIKVVEGRGPNPKLYVHIEKIESKLDDLTREVLASQKNPLRLLSSIEELRGLLLDLRT